MNIYRLSAIIIGGTIGIIAAYVFPVVPVIVIGGGLTILALALLTEITVAGTARRYSRF